MKTTKAHYDKFKGYVRYWQKELGLHDWHICFEHRKLGDAYAQTSYKVADRAANITFATSWDRFREPNDRELSMCALHEVMHIVTAPLFAEADSRYTTQMDVESAEHGLVTRLTNYIFGMPTA